MSLSGARATWNNYTLDDVANSYVNFNLYVVLPSVDALQEFKVQSGIYPPNLGPKPARSTSPQGIPTPRRSSFAKVNMATRGAAPARSQDLQRQEPLVLHVEFERYKSRTTGVSLATALTAAMRAGDFRPSPRSWKDPNTRVGNVERHRELQLLHHHSHAAFRFNLTIVFSYTCQRPWTIPVQIWSVANVFLPGKRPLPLLRFRFGQFLGQFQCPQRFVASVLYNLPFG